MIHNPLRGGGKNIKHPWHAIQEEEKKKKQRSKIKKESLVNS